MLHLISLCIPFLYTGHSNVGHHGCRLVLRVLQQVTCAVLGGETTSNSDLLHQTATVRLPAGCTGLCVPDPSGIVQLKPNQIC